MIIHTSIIIYILFILNTIKLALFSPTNPYDLLMFTAFLGCFKMHQTQTPSLGWSFGCGRYVCHLRLLLASLSLRHPAATTCTSSINDHPPQTDLLTSPHLTKKKASRKKKKTPKNSVALNWKTHPTISPRVLRRFQEMCIYIYINYIYIYPIPQNVVQHLLSIFPEMDQLIPDLGTHRTRHDLPKRDAKQAWITWIIGQKLGKLG